MKNKKNSKHPQHSGKACQWACIVKSSLLVSTFFAILAIVLLIWLEKKWLPLSAYAIGALITFTPAAIITFLIKAIIYDGEPNPWVRLVQSSSRIGMVSSYLWMVVMAIYWIVDMAMGITKYQQLASGYVLFKYLINAAFIFIFVTAIAFGIKTLLRTIGNNNWKIQEASNLISHLLSKYENYNYFDLSVDEAQELSTFILSLSKDYYQELERMSDETFKLAKDRLLGEIILEFPEVKST